MEYLVLRPFRSFGVHFAKGSIVDASQVRTPRLKMSEGKIIPAVSSSNHLAADAAVQEPQGVEKNEIKKPLFKVEPKQTFLNKG